MTKTLRAIGWVWLTLIGIVIFVSYAAIISRQGWGRFVEIVSPFNIINYIAIFIAAAPGLGCLWGANRLAGRKKP